MSVAIKAIKPKPYYPQALPSGRDTPSVDLSRFILPRRLTPFVFLFLACFTCIVAMFAVEPATPAPLPQIQPYSPPQPVAAAEPVTIPSEIAEVASLIPPAAAATLPVTKSERTYNKPRISVRNPSSAISTDRTAKLMQSGIAAARDGRRTEALQLLDKAQRLAPDDPRVLYNLAVLHDRMGDREQAAIYYRQVIQYAQPGQAIDYRRVAARYSQLHPADNNSNTPDD